MYPIIRFSFSFKKFFFSPLFESRESHSSPHKFFVVCRGENDGVESTTTSSLTPLVTASSSTGTEKGECTHREMGERG